MDNPHYVVFVDGGCALAENAGVLSALMKAVENYVAFVKPCNCTDEMCVHITRD